MSELQVGLLFSDTVEVTDEMSPPHLPNKVLSTPDMVRLIEGTCLFGVQPHLDEGQTTVGGIEPTCTEYITRKELCAQKKLVHWPLKAG
jgi:hypothetical protein